MVAGGWTGTTQEGTGGITAGHRHHHHHDVESAHTRTHGHHRVLHHDVGLHRLEVHLGGAEGVLATAHIAATAEAEVGREAARQVAHDILADGELKNEAKADMAYCTGCGNNMGKCTLNSRLKGLVRSFDAKNGCLPRAFALTYRQGLVK